VSALAVADGHAAGELGLDFLRGRSSYAMPVQFAEVALRRQLAETRDDAVRLVSRQVADGVTDAVFAVAGATWAVRVSTAPGAELLQLTCKATRDNPVPLHELLAITRTG
jgi:hypothetical protein